MSSEAGIHHIDLEVGSQLHGLGVGSVEEKRGAQRWWSTASAEATAVRGRRAVQSSV